MITKVWAFRIIAGGVPALLGLIVIGIIAAQRQLLVVGESGALKLQAAPLYVQEPGHETTGHKYQYDSQLGWRNIANWKATTFGRELKTNSKHLRDREYAFEKPADWKRVLILGDSFAWGYGVANREIFTEVLEDHFERFQRPYQVINTGVSGWGTDQQLLFLQAEGIKYSPDIVILAFYLGNDPSNCVESVQYGLHKPVFMDLDLSLRNVPVPKPPADQSETIRSQVDRHTLAVRIIEEIVKTCQSINADFVLMKFGVFQQPDHPAVLAANADFEAKLDRIRSSIHYLDLDHEFRTRALSFAELTEGVDDGHWNAHGHGIVADILHEYLLTSSLVPSR